MKKFNIIVPTINLDAYVLNFFKKINDQNHSSYYVTIVTNNINKNIKKFSKYKNCKIIFTKKNSIGFKRNLGANTFRSKYLVFFDSDSYPNKNWLNIAEIHLQSNDVVGGPSIPFPNTRGLKKICHNAKRSFFTTGFLNFRKYKSSSRLCEWLESCNFAIKKNVYLKLKGMDKKLVIGEDKDFFYKASKTIKNFKIFFHPDLFIYHDERPAFKFFLQRAIYGTAIFDLFKPTSIRDYAIFLPIIICLLLLLLIKENFKYGYLHLILTTAYIMLFFLIIIYFNTYHYVKSKKKIILTIIFIFLANISFVVGNFIWILGFKDKFQNFFYKKSRKY